MTKNAPIVVVEDDYVACQTLIGQLNALGYTQTWHATNAESAMELFKQKAPQLAIIDIALADSNLDGIELAKEINAKFPDCAILFTTSYSDKTTLDRVREVKYESYLLKPIHERYLYVTLELLSDNSAKGVSTRSGNACDHVFLKGGSKYYQRIDVKDILYIKSETSGITITLANKSSLFTYNSLQGVIEQINHPDLIRVQRSWAVNKKYVVGKSENQLRMSDGTEIPIGQKYKPIVDSQFFLIKPKGKQI